MSNIFFKKNIATLEKRFPALIKTISATPTHNSFQISVAKSGSPTLCYQAKDGSNRYLHSIYRPESEAEKLISSLPLKDYLNFMVIGSGLGYSLLELTKRVSKNSKIVLIEKNLEVFKLALESLDWTNVLQHPGLSLLISPSDHELNENLSRVAFAFAVNGFLPIIHKPSISLSPDFYHKIDTRLSKSIQETELNIKTQSKLSQTFFFNIMENVPAIIDSPGILNLKSKMTGIPAAVISAGPSLDKNIKLLKHSSENLLLIAVSTALKPLLKAGIEPDFVVAIDSDETTVKGFNLNSIPKKTFLLFDPTVPWVIPNAFKDRRYVIDSEIYFSKWIAEKNGAKGYLGKTLSVAHTGMLLAKHLGCSPVILLGQDLAFYKNKMHCSGTFYQNDFIELTRTEITPNSLEKNKFKKYEASLKETLDIFGQKTNTTVALESYKNLFENIIASFQNVLNATEGGLPINGAQSLTLKEVLIKFCSNKINKSSREFLFEELAKKDKSTLKESLEELSQILDFWSQELLILDKSIKPEKSYQKIFINEMKTHYKKLTENPQLGQLLQGFSYKEFLEWNRANYKICLGNERPEKIEELKFQRDRGFLPTLRKTCSVVQTSIKKTLKRI